MSETEKKNTSALKEEKASASPSTPLPLKWEHLALIILAVGLLVEGVVLAYQMTFKAKEDYLPPAFKELKEQVDSLEEKTLPLATKLDEVAEELQHIKHQALEEQSKTEVQIVKGQPDPTLKGAFLVTQLRRSFALGQVDKRIIRTLEPLVEEDALKHALLSLETQESGTSIITLSKELGAIVDKVERMFSSPATGVLKSIEGWFGSMIKVKKIAPATSKEKPTPTPFQATLKEAQFTLDNGDLGRACQLLTPYEHEYGSLIGDWMAKAKRRLTSEQTLGRLEAYFLNALTETHASSQRGEPA